MSTPTPVERRFQEQLRGLSESQLRATLRATLAAQGNTAQKQQIDATARSQALLGLAQQARGRGDANQIVVDRIDPPTADMPATKIVLGLAMSPLFPPLAAGFLQSAGKDFETMEEAAPYQEGAKEGFSQSAVAAAQAHSLAIQGVSHQTQVAMVNAQLATTRAASMQQSNSTAMVQSLPTPGTSN